MYYSGYVPVSNDSRLPALGTEVPMVRENRLYQADWLMRFYGFDTNEILDKNHPFLDLEVDPKLAWALRNREKFPVNINTAPKEMLLRIPGVGVTSVNKILMARKFQKLNLEHLKKNDLFSKMNLDKENDIYKRFFRKDELQSLLNERKVKLSII